MKRKLLIAVAAILLAGLVGCHASYSGSLASQSQVQGTSY